MDASSTLNSALDLDRRLGTATPFVSPALEGGRSDGLAAETRTAIRREFRFLRDASGLAPAGRLVRVLWAGVAHVYAFTAVSYCAGRSPGEVSS